MRMRSPTLDELVNEFLSEEDITMFGGLMGPFADPELVWQAILKLLAGGLSDTQIASLAAGPLEDLIGMHGSKFIDRIEAEAKRNVAFADLLGGVWQGSAPFIIWERVEAARGRRCW